MRRTWCCPMNYEREDCERVVPRARICELLKAEGHLAEVNGKGNVVVSCPWPAMEEGRKRAVSRKWLTEERRKLGAWRKTIHRRVSQLSGGVWVTVKEQSGPVVMLRMCKRCDKPMRCPGMKEGCECACLRCQVSHHDVCDYVLVCSLAVVPRGRLNRRGMEATQCVVAAETVLMARARHGNVWSCVPTDVVHLILNIVLKPSRLCLRRKQAEWS